MSENNQNILAKAPIWKALAHLCIPMIAGLLIGVVYNIVNAGFIGSLPESTPLLAALTFSLPVFSLLMAVGNVFGVGGGTYISRLLGSDQHEEPQPASGANAAEQDSTGIRIRQVGAFTVWGAALGGVVVGILGVIFATPISMAIGASGADLLPTSQYIGAMFAFAPALVCAFAMEQVVRSEGAATASMIGLIASTIANLVFDVLFILILGWGVLGAGIALGLSNVVAVAYYGWWLSRRAAAVSIAPKWFHIDRTMLATVFGVGVSEFLQASFLIVTGLVLNWIAIAYGDALLAAFGVAQRVAQFPEMICMGLFMGAVPLFAFSFGAGNQPRLHTAVRNVAIAIAGVTVVCSGLMFLFRNPLFALFSHDPAVVSDGVLILTAMLISTLFNGFTGLIIAVFQATEQMKAATVMSVLQGVLFIPVVLIGNAVFGMNGVIWAMTATEIMTFIVGIVLYLVGSRRPQQAPVPDVAVR
ncbi:MULTISPECIES: MATE family efflux transporter [Bifidobacterium]|jgi:putative MATE family efflux protein|nr:MATE family efflux transporter [Bifidobacterium tibiigranuli]MCH3973936.1 hypothetical protein [Bifidobacterium tibiigranuli]MCH4190349.1 hypothetical protein [Bifidobacterium tibiigranuli]MCH4203930.1 hypothetical protein [Bifidobacterium tibiigranuli]MCH4274228.1 hypothetical protein [Bifidobacterium tibiigranuli]MCI1211794.1 MATE family efflux transporter [Bifidobacterium tibiigranuli]